MTASLNPLPHPRVGGVQYFGRVTDAEASAFRAWCADRDVTQQGVLRLLVTALAVRPDAALNARVEELLVAEVGSLGAEREAEWQAALEPLRALVAARDAAAHRVKDIELEAAAVTKALMASEQLSLLRASRVAGISRDVLRARMPVCVPLAGVATEARLATYGAARVAAHEEVAQLLDDIDDAVDTLVDRGYRRKAIPSDVGLPAGSRRRARRLAEEKSA